MTSEATAEPVMTAPPATVMVTSAEGVPSEVRSAPAAKAEIWATLTSVPNILDLTIN